MIIIIVIFIDCYLLSIIIIMMIFHDISMFWTFVFVVGALRGLAKLGRRRPRDGAWNFTGGRPVDQLTNGTSRPGGSCPNPPVTKNGAPNCRLFLWNKPDFRASKGSHCQLSRSRPLIFVVKLSLKWVNWKCSVLQPSNFGNLMDVGIFVELDDLEKHQPSLLSSWGKKPPIISMIFPSIDLHS